MILSICLRFGGMVWRCEKKRAQWAERVQSTPAVTVYRVFYIEYPIVIMLMSLLSSPRVCTLQNDDRLEHPLTFLPPWDSRPGG